MTKRDEVKKDISDLCYRLLEQGLVSEHGLVEAVQVGLERHAKRIEKDVSKLTMALNERITAAFDERYGIKRGE